jgi:hypothetical protein
MAKQPTLARSLPKSTPKTSQYPKNQDKNNGNPNRLSRMQFPNTPA